MKLVRTALMLSMLSLTLNGCSSKGGAQDAGLAGMGADAGGLGAGAGAGGPRINKYGQGGDGGMYGANGAGAGSAGAYDDAALNDPSSPLSKRVIYFMYDSYEVLPEYQSVVTAHAGYLASHPNRAVVLEGHADERGSPEYNVALAEQRGKAVGRMLQLQGVGDGQVQVVSFGEEKPAVPGHDESAWQQNRRVEISYPGQ